MTHDGQNAILIVGNLPGRDILPSSSPSHPLHIPSTSDDAYQPLTSDLYPSQKDEPFALSSQGISFRGQIRRNTFIATLPFSGGWSAH